MDFYICSTPYHLFVSLCFITNRQNDSILYLTTHDKNSFEIFSNLYERLKKYPYIKNVKIRFRNRKKEKLRIEFLKDVLEYGEYKEYIEKGHVYNFAWNPYSTYSTSNYIFKRAKSVTFVEEGTILYAFPKPSKLNLFVKRFFYGISTNFYKESKLIEVLVHFPERYPGYLRHKLKSYSVVQLFDGLSVDQKEDIVGVFLTREEVKYLLGIETENCVIVLTQPLSEDGFISEKEKIQLYEEIINQNSEYSIILKKHPRELTEYPFQNVLELDGFFPSEIFTMLNMKFNKAIGICTSAVTSINANESINTDEDFLKRRKKND